MKTTQITVINESGLHARPASIFVQAAKQYNSKIAIRNITTGSSFADAKSILGVLVLGVEKNHIVEIEVDGEDEERAAIHLENLIRDSITLL